MEKRRYTFVTDNQELIDFIETFGRKRSTIINQLLIDCMEDGQGYISPRIMYETGFSYNKKNTKLKVKKIANKKPKIINKKDDIEIQKENSIDALNIPNKNDDLVEENHTNIEDKQPEIENINNEMPINTELLSAGLSAFGI